MSMNSTSTTDTSPSVTELVSGIVGDIQDLGIQHLALFRREVNEDLRKATDAIASLAIGLAITLIGGVILGLMLVYLLAQLAPGLPLWGCYGIVGAGIAVLGAVGVFRGIAKLRTVDSLSRKATQVMKEDVEWLTNPK